jgi:hypothetical protein
MYMKYSIIARSRVALNHNPDPHLQFHCCCTADSIMLVYEPVFFVKRQYNTSSLTSRHPDKASGINRSIDHIPGLNDEDKSQ